jgi:uncharacterized protein YdhG (YjbR/CyaY superfamily)
MKNVKEKEKLADVDDYISRYPEDTQRILIRIRKIILKEAPTAVESMAYQMPAYKLGGKPLVYFAGFKNHIGLYATPTAHYEFKDELSGYKQGKGSVQFQLNQPIPFDLIRKMVKFKVRETGLL